MKRYGKAKGNSKRTRLASSQTRSVSTLSKRRKGYFPLYRPVYAGRMAIPMQLKNQMYYSETVNILVGVGNFNTYIFSCNGLYDPNITGTGTQPLYFDQLAALYNHYTVVSSFIQISCTGAGQVASTASSRIGVYIDDDTTVVSTMDSLITRQGAKWGQANLSQGGKINLRMGWSAAKTFPGNPLGNTDLQGNAGANPTEQSYYVIGVDDPTGVATNFYFTVKLTFNVVWDEKKTIGTS